MPPKTMRSAALLFNLYCKNQQTGQVLAFAEALAQHLALQPQGEGRWQHTQQEMILRIQATSQHDTQLLQIICNTEALGEDFWRSTAETIHGGLEDALQKTAIQTWGQTFVYQAETSAKSIKNADAALFGMQDGTLPPLAQDIPGGRLWLLTTPGSDPAKDMHETIYLAVTNKKGEKDQEAFFFNESAFILPDLIVHKAFFCARQYRKILKHNDLDQLLHNLADSTGSVLNMRDALLPETQKGLNEISIHLKSLLRYSAELTIQKTSLAQQQWNLALLLGDAPQGAVHAHLTQRVSSYLHEVSLKSGQCQHQLDLASQAVELVKAQQNELIEVRRQRQEFWLAFLGLFLAVPQLLTYDATGILLKVFSCRLSELGVLAVQGGLTFLVVVPLAFLIKRIGQAVRKK